MDEKTRTQQQQNIWRYWRGLGAWNLYFLLKFALLWFGYLNFHPLLNLVFLAFLLFPIPNVTLHRWRHIIAIPLGIGLFYHDTWLPGINSILSQGTQVVGFSSAYLLELLNRFINWQMIGAAVVITVAYLFFAQWIRITVFTVAALAWLNIVNLAGPAISLMPAALTTPAPSVAASPKDGGAALPEATLPPTNANLTAYLNQFYTREKARTTVFPATLPQDAQPFDLLIINICSLSWSDLEVAQLENHPLWKKFDILFRQFNSAAAYSGPASIRLLRASCGQQSHTDLYQPVNEQCYLFSNLVTLGFEEQLMLDHSGIFGNYLREVREEGNIQIPMLSQEGISHQITSFDGEPIYNDLELLNRWLGERDKATTTRNATFFNLLPLHDGNRFVGSNQSADYAPRAKILFDQLDAFFDVLQKSGRKVMVIVVPEHGAALAGDKMQMSGLRDIPSPSITHVPVGVKMFGLQAPHQGDTLEITSPSSHMAISELVARMVDGKVFTAPSVDWQALTSALPQTEAISENENSIVMQYQGKPYIRLNGGDWVPYPQ
ncbi:cellulose biosynthesis protein BcsG [Pectobacterium atrosepticum]|uniref:cellulose biosynthesis protein BcsG n=1 Tax=Pectobacterium atrosepticum TaxID=29471 RepID=UPI00039B720A|nr:cellulose biosynthesis protein BcsG [Pectobacterium atrosepticum]GKV87552.1 membrane protein [Pectobacterium carotovorum subsp. carotovorum]AIA73125.1 membrane protein [Pectobacterium atrosepticum]AIK16148.1 cellulose biosynthesis protein BcsG [Pectobacterium atrosepticum]KFX13192.1 membrane protein [Pectobacterium atrosepticum]KFX23331.1 membrane protein [Pectobacterium atrosepticum]